MDLVREIFVIFLFGLAGGVNPGPILISSCAESLNSGFVKSLKVVFWALIAESLVAAIVLLAVFYLEPPMWVFYLIALFGAGYLFYIAYQLIQVKAIKTEESMIFSFRKILIMTLLNGPFWVFWLTICLPLAFEFNKKVLAGNFLFLLFFELGWLVSTVAVVFVFSHSSAIINNKKVFRAVYVTMALILIYFALKMIFNSLTFFL